MSTLLINSTLNQSYQEQITKTLNNYYSNPSKKTPIEKLRLRRNRLLEEMRVVAKKLFNLEREYFEPIIASLEQVEAINLSVDIFREILVTKEQKEFWLNLSKKDKYLSKLYREYLKALMDIDLEIISLQSQSIAIKTTA